MSTWRWAPPAGFSCEDVLTFLRGLPDESVDLFSTDPPYGLAFMGSVWDSPNKGVPGAAKGVEAFRSFSAWCTAWATECLRVLRPGGYLLAMGGTSTYDALAWGIRMAGFEIRDSIAAPGVGSGATAWIFGSGMPHSKAELKSAFEFICCARKPFNGTLAANVAAYGTGGLDIDAGRIPATGKPPGWLKTGTVGTNAAKGFQGTSTFRMAERTPEQVAHVGEVHDRLGRWPSNYALVHDSRCERVGSTKITAVVGTAQGRMAGGRSIVGVYRPTRGSDRAGEATGYGDAQGKEEVAVWRCHQDCAVPKLDAQTGVLKSGRMAAGTKRKASNGVGFQGTATFAHKGVATPVDTIADAGGPSRFFTLPDPDAVTVGHLAECAIVGVRKLPGDNRGDLGGRRPGGFLQPFAGKGDGKPNARVYAGGEIPIYKCALGCPVSAPLTEAVFDPLEGRDAAVLEVGFYHKKVYPRDRVLPGYWMIVPKDPEHPERPGVDRALAETFCELWGIPVAEDETALEALTGWPLPPGVWGGEEPAFFQPAVSMHPTQKPLALASWLVRVFSPRPERVGRPVVVVDPFGGSGTFVLAAHQLGRVGVYNDFTPKYVAIAAARLGAAGLAAPPMVAETPAPLVLHAPLAPPVLLAVPPESPESPEPTEVPEPPPVPIRRSVFALSPKE